MFPHALQLVCKWIHVEMEAAKPQLRMNIGDVSSEFIEQWDIHHIMGPVACNTMPTLNTILEAAGESKVSAAKPKSAKSKNRFTALLIIMAQIHFLWSRHSAKVPIGLSLQAWVCGTSRQMIDVLHQPCLVVSYPSVLTMVHSLADRSIKRVKAALLLPHALIYDNINISSSIFVEQGPNAMSKVQSGTFTVIYKLLNAHAEDMDISPVIKNIRCPSPLNISDLQMTPHTRVLYVSHLLIFIVQILAKYVKGFEAQQSDMALQHPQRQFLPVGHKTVFHPLRASTIKEASIDSNLLVHDNIYLVQLSHELGDLNSLAIPMFNNQLMNLGFSSFHLAMNLLWCVLETHQGTLNQMGSLTHLFALLEKTRLGGEHPDYNTLLSALMQILHGLILNVWHIECNHSSLHNVTEANPSPNDLLTCVYQIILKYASPDPTCNDVNPKAHPKDLASRVEPKKPPVNVVHNNIISLTRDLLCVVELIDAMATGDFRQIEDILPALACMF
ncbi:hypothetical protein EI94DRAFT_1593629 [Lactarius quietus]|nr:hypothetical protein EI94DRAFT_1593629 [Lactarius quietus]